jgi:hypothetical protein
MPELEEILCTVSKCKILESSASSGRWGMEMKYGENCLLMALFLNPGHLIDPP